jgi:hypothetical protein
LVLAVALTVALVAPPAGAADAPERWPSILAPQALPIYDIPRHDYTPPGLYLGSFLILPTAVETASYDDNIFASQQRVANDYVNTTQEGVSAQSDWSQHSLSGSFVTAQQVYAAHPNEDANTYAATVSGRYDISGDAFVQFDASGSQQPQSRAAVVAVTGTGARPIYNDWRSQVSYEQQFGPWAEYAQARIEKIAYITSDALTFSYLQPSYRDRITYNFTDRVGVFFEATFEQRQWQVAPGLRNSDSFTGLAGIAYHVPTIIDGELGAGMLRQTYENAAFATLYTPVLNGQVTWNFLPLTSILATAYRTVTGTEIVCVPNSGTCQTAAGLTPIAGSNRIGQRDTHESTAVTTSLQHEFYHNLLGEAQVGYQHDVFDFNDLVDNTYEVNGNVRYLMNRHSEVDFAYIHRIRTANQPSDRTFNSGAFDENVLLLSVKAGW